MTAAARTMERDERLSTGVNAIFVGPVCAFTCHDESAPLMQGPSLLSELQRTRSALEQAEAEAVLQFGDAPGERRLGAPCGARGAAEPAMTCDQIEIG